MTAAELTLVTIVAEKVLEAKLERLVKDAGATGYTVTEARGEGSRHQGSHTFEGQNVRIETVVADDVAALILDQIAEHYFAHYGVIAYTTKINVVRGEKYLR
jgi:nitrogen regulatory protein P-II 2